MDDDGQGNFTYTLTAKLLQLIIGSIRDAWGQYQLVASDRSLARIAGSAQYLNNITVGPCPSGDHFSRQALDVLRSSKHVAVLTGAGVSQESGLRTFRDAQDRIMVAI